MRYFYFGENHHSLFKQITIILCGHITWFYFALHEIQTKILLNTEKIGRFSVHFVSHLTLPPERKRKNSITLLLRIAD